jgi:hypothetical protein
MRWRGAFELKLALPRSSLPRSALQPARRAAIAAADSRPAQVFVVPPDAVIR